MLHIIPNFAVPFIPQPLTPPSSGGSGGGGDGDDGMTQPETPQGDLVPTLTPPGMRPTLSAAQPASSVLPSLLGVTMGVFLIFSH